MSTLLVVAAVGLLGGGTLGAILNHIRNLRGERIMRASLMQARVVLIDVDSGVPFEELTQTAAALQRQMREDFSPSWGVGADMTVVAATSSKPGDIRIEYRKTPGAGDEGALAVHDLDEHGVPLARVFPILCRMDGETPSSAASHELCELAADPYLRDCVQLSDGRIAAKEVCDQVQAQTYVKDGVTLSNFCTPANFSPVMVKGHVLPGERYDFLGNLKSPFEVADGGYAQVYEKGKGWSQLGAAKGYRARLKALGIPSRATKRGATDGASWTVRP